jgi:hypothetical protein
MRATILLLLTASIAAANIGSYPGGWGSEPTGLENIRIVNEVLFVDLRACDGSHLDTGSFELKQPVGKVQATYILSNLGPVREVHLIFAAGVDIKQDAVKVTLDGEPVAVEQAPIGRLRWEVPITTPAFDGREPIGFDGADNRANFTMYCKIPSGRSTLRVTFRTLIGGRLLTPAACWQFVYLLAPARDWNGFDRLDVTVLIPPGWEAASNLDLRRDGDALVGSFDQLPGDALALTVRMPVGPIRERIDQARQLGWIAVIVGIPAALFLARVVLARANGFAGRPFQAWLFLIMVATAWGTAAWWCSYAFVVYPRVTVPRLQRPPGAGIAELIAWFFAIVFAIVAPIVICIFAWWRPRLVPVDMTITNKET